MGRAGSGGNLAVIFAPQEQETEQKLAESMLARAAQGPSVRIVIRGNIPLVGMEAVTTPAMPAPKDPDMGDGPGSLSDRDRDDLL